ncbi:sensor domain-containing diguanylate cyclase [Paenibacillus psychroresistens]|uniref:sensor domain-containing diguanylate cyclase n=1 Tax=Paenibacillus psychroresistens TaxID=1778678 RepID=UPI001390F893|nr:sensor domain-containing diguanylate cyclase [Paenibacillus psychroresistens]
MPNHYLIDKNEIWFRSLYENNSDGIISIDCNGRIIGVNPAILRITETKQTDYIHRHLSKLKLNLKEMESEKLIDAFYRSFHEAPQSFEETFLRSNGTSIELRFVNVPVERNGKRIGNHIIVKDISEEKHSQEHIRHQAFHDELTGLPNRRLFNLVLSQIIETSYLNGSGFAVMAIDLDRFKLINDSLGHAYGDVFLKMVSERISKSVEGYAVTIARMGGDEFTLICDGDSLQEYSLMAERIMNEIQQPYLLKDSEFHMSSSIGIAIYPEHGLDAEQLQKNADIAMYAVKKKSKNNYHFYSTGMDKKELEKFVLEGDLRNAIDRGELQIYLSAPNPDQGS